MTATTPFVLLLIALGVAASPLRAQVDIESLRRDGAPAGMSGSVGATLDVETGNTELFEVEGTARLNWVRGAGQTLFIGEGGLGLLSEERFSSSALLHLRHMRWIEEWIAPEAYAQVNYDRSQLLDSRRLVGLGLRFRVTEGEWGGVGAGTSVMLEKEYLDLPADASHPASTRTVRNSTFVTLRLLAGSQFAVSSTTYAQPAFADVGGDLRILENLRANVSLTGQLALSVTFDLRYDSGPPDGTEALDTKLRTGLAFTF